MLRKSSIKNKAAVILTIHGGDRYTAEGRRRIVSWLRKQAAWFDRNQKNVSPKFRARYLVPA